MFNGDFFLAESFFFVEFSPRWEKWRTQAKLETMAIGNMALKNLFDYEAEVIRITKVHYKDAIEDFVHNK